MKDYKRDMQEFTRALDTPFGKYVVPTVLFGSILADVVRGEFGLSVYGFALFFGHRTSACGFGDMTESLEKKITN